MNPTTILFNGPPRCGKDTATQFAKEILGLRAATYRFAKPLKDAAHALFGMGGIATEALGLVKEQPNEAMFGMTPRNAYIWLSEEVVKPKFGQDFFAKVAVTNINRLMQHYGGLAHIVISDCGFQAEFDVLAEAFGADNVHLCQLERAGCSFKGDSRGYIESSKHRHGILNNGTLDEFRHSIQNLLKEIINA